jgi:hypothetical protein
MLKIAAPAYAEQGALRLPALRGGFKHFHKTRLGVIFFFADNLDAHFLPGQGVGRKNDLAVYPAHTRAAGSNLFDNKRVDAPTLS